MTLRARVSAAACLAVLVVSSAVVTAAPVAAQTATPTFVLARQSPWVAPGAGFVMNLDATNVPAGAQVALTVHDALQSRTAFDATVDGGNLPTTRDRRTFPFDQLPTDPATGQRQLAYSTAGLGENGVFPVEVDLRSAADESLAHFVTHVVVAPIGADGTLNVGVPLNVAWVWPLQTDPAFIGGSNPVNLRTLADLAPTTGRLGRQTAQLAANTDVPLTLAPSPETLESWAALGAKSPPLAQGTAAVRAAAISGNNQVLAGPYVPLDLPSVVRGNLEGVVTSVAPPGEIPRGLATLDQFLGSGAHVDPSTALPGHLDAASVGILQSASVRQLVVDGAALTPVTEKYTPAHPYKLQTAGADDATAPTVLATDDGLEQFLSGDDPPALRAAHLLAGLALVAGEQPSISRGVAIANPARWDANSSFVDAVLTGLRNNPLVHATTVEGLLQSVHVATVDDEPDAAPVFRQLANYAPPLPPVTAAQYARGVHDRDAVAALVKSPDDARVQAADRALATSLAAAWANPAGRKQATALLDSIGGSLTSYLAQVEVQPTSTITVTSSKAEIPISFRNNSDDAITVHLQLASDRLLFPDGAERDVVLPQHHNTTVRVAVETRGSGTAPVHLTVTTLGGLVIKEDTIIKVRSSFVSGVGVFLTVGAIVFLVVWWGWDIQRRRKKRSREQHPTYRVAPPSAQPA